MPTSVKYAEWPRCAAREADVAGKFAIQQDKAGKYRFRLNAHSIGVTSDYK